MKPEINDPLIKELKEKVRSALLPSQFLCS